MGGKRIGLPVAVVGEYDGGRGLKELRVYHSTWLLTGSHRVRPPLLSATPGLRLPDVVERYQRGLAKLGTCRNNIDKLLSVFTRQCAGLP